jgi:hypothetical protein
MAVSKKSGKDSPSPHISDTEISDNLPPPRGNAGELQRVPAPLSHTRLSRLVYFLAALTALIATYYGMHEAQLQVRDWGRALGWPSSFEHGKGGGGGERAPGSWWSGEVRRSEENEDTRDVDEQVAALAEVLGVPVADLAAAVAGVQARGRTMSKGGGEVPVVQATPVGKTADESDDAGTGTGFMGNIADE